MKKILIFIIIIVISCSSILFFYDIQLDRSSGIIRITGRTAESQTRSFFYRQWFPFRYFAKFLNDIPVPVLHKEALYSKDEYAPPFLKGESLIYDVYYAGIKTGESVLTFHGEKDLEGEKVYYITFSTKLPFFKDYEDIYASKDTFLPVKINRSITKLAGLSTEIIEEKYDQDNFTVTISRGREPSKNSMVIKKDSPIYNAILLTYYYRANPHVYKDGVFKIVLPTKEFNIQISGEDTIITPAGEYHVHVFTSKPSKFTFYLSKDNDRLPVKIESHTALNYALILKSRADSS
jgi:hypothetical protein